MKNPFLTPKFNSDKIQLGLMEEYKSILNPLKNRPISFMELGIKFGGSIQYWDDFLKHPEAQIVGLDLKVPDIEMSDRVTLYECDQNDSEQVKQIGDKHGPFDLVIDDASHFAKETRKCWDILWPKVKMGGYYIIEDWAVGYFGKQLPQYEGMIEVVTNIMTKANHQTIKDFQIINEPGKSMAFFQKGIFK